jgi:hypothetical protein
MEKVDWDFVWRRKHKLGSFRLGNKNFHMGIEEET